MSASTNIGDLINQGKGVYQIPTNFLIKKTSPDTANLRQLDTLANHATYLYHTNPIAMGAVETITTNTIGESGLRVQSKINYQFLGITAEQAEEYQQQIENVFNMLADSTFLDVAGIHNFKQLQEIAYRTYRATGGTLVLYPYLKDDKDFKTKIKLLEAIQLRNNNNEIDTPNVAGGVETDNNGKVIKYHVLKTHPNSDNFVAKWSIIPRKSGYRYNAIHIFKEQRAGQRRGVPYIASVLDVFRKLGDYSEAELDAALLNARFTGFIWRDTPSQAPDEIPDEEAAEEHERTPNIELKKGNLVQLEEGWKVDFANPVRPNTNFGTFFEAQVKIMCIGLNIPFELFMKNFTASYSASRGAIIEGKKFFNSEKKDFAFDFCQPTFENVINQAVLDGILDLPGFFNNSLTRQAWLGTEWIGDAQEELDPLKAVNAAKTRVEEGFSNRDKEAKEMNGTDFNRNVQIGKKETQLLKEAGLKEVKTNG